MRWRWIISDNCRCGEVEYYAAWAEAKARRYEFSGELGLIHHISVFLIWMLPIISGASKVDSTQLGYWIYCRNEYHTAQLYGKKWQIDTTFFAYGIWSIVTPNIIYFTVSCRSSAFGLYVGGVEVGSGEVHLLNALLKTKTLTIIIAAAKLNSTRLKWIQKH